MENDSKNKRAEQICGLRLGGMFIDFPVELGFECPKRKNHYLDWSEYKFFIWCEQCNYDYPSPLCIKNREKATEVYLDILEEIKTKYGK